MTSTWQHPYVNIFKSFKLAQNGPKLAKKGDVQSRSEKLVKSIVYTITGQVPANAYIQFPAKSQESLDLVGRFFYITFKPLPQAYFTFHLDILTDDTRQSVRISISNLFKEYKSSNTWLQFPMIVDSAPGTPDHNTESLRIPDGRKSPEKPAWMMLCLDLKSILAVHLNRKYGCLKSLRICANLTVRNCFTSDVEFCPTISPTQARQCGILKMNEQYSPMPREMNFPMDIKSENCGEDWDKNYVYLRYPNTRIPGPFNIIRRANLTAVEYFGKENIMPGVPFLDGKAVEKDAARPGSNIFNQTSPKKRSKTKEEKVECRITELPEFNLGNMDNLENNHKVEASGCLAGDTHVFFDDTQSKDKSRKLVDSEFSSDINLKKLNSGSTGTNSGNNSTFDVEMKTQSVFGFSTYTKKRNCNQTTIHPNGVDYFYAAGNSIIRMRNNEQIEILTGHSGPVVALTINSIGTLLISAQANPGESYSIIRVWSLDFCEKQCTSCISMSRIPHTDLSFLVLSESGDYLAGVGNLKSGVQYLLVWDVSAVQSNGDISIFAKATIHAGSSGNVEGVCFVNNDRRLVTYGGYQKVDNQNGSCLKLWELQ